MGMSKPENADFELLHSRNSSSFNDRGIFLEASSPSLNSECTYENEETSETSRMKGHLCEKSAKACNHSGANANKWDYNADIMQPNGIDDKEGL